MELVMHAIGEYWRMLSRHGSLRVVDLLSEFQEAN